MAAPAGASAGDSAARKAPDVQMQAAAAQTHNSDLGRMDWLKNVILINPTQSDNEGTVRESTKAVKICYIKVS